MGIVILSIDPGTTMTGVVVSTVIDGNVNVLCATTINAEVLMIDKGGINDTHGKRFTRELCISEVFMDMLLMYKPDVVVSESPFMGRFPQAFAALVELITFLKFTLFSYDRSIEFVTIDPKSVKVTMGVSGNSSNKNLMRNSLLSNNCIRYQNNLNPFTFDEHTVDALAVGLWYYSQLGEKYNDN